MLESRKSGFTIVEMMVVLAVIGILTIVITTNGQFAVDKASKTSTLVDIGVYQVSIESIIMTSEEPITSITDLLYQLNNDLDGQFQLEDHGNCLESVSKTNKDGDNYRIYTSDFVHYRIECGKYGKEVWVTREEGLYEERIYAD